MGKKYKPKPKSFFVKFLSLILSFTLFISLLPLGLIAKAESDGSEKVQKPQKVEVIEKRTADSKTIDNGDGTFTKEVYAQPVHRKVGDKWEEISPNLIDTTDSNGEFATQNTDIDIKFKSQMKNGEYVTVKNGDHRLSYTFLGAEGEQGKISPTDTKATKKENQITYENVLPGVNLRNILFNSSSKEDIILTRPVNLNRFMFKIDSDLIPQKDENGSIIFKDSKGEVLFTLPRPFMSDSNIDEKSGESQRSENVSYDLKQDGTGWILTLAADANWLNDSARKYPIYIDPSTNLAVSQDTFVASAYPTTNYESFWDSGEGCYTLKVGYYDSTTGTNAAYVKFNTTGLNGMIIDSASFGIDCQHSYYSSTATGIWLDRVNAAWSASTMTWNNRPASSYLGYNTVYEGNYVYFDITSTVQDWVNNPSTNYGVKLHTNSNGQSFWKKFRASENSTAHPYLSINYHINSPTGLTGTPYGNTGSNTGYVDLKWNTVSGATGYKVLVFNGISYESYDVGNITQWSTKNKKIWPTASEITSGRYALHHDNLGVELALDPSPVYRNSHGTYGTRTYYFFRVTAYNSNAESAQSAAVTPTIPLSMPTGLTGLPCANLAGINTGYVDLKWNPVPGATGYKVWVFNGIQYESYDVQNVTEWSTENKKIWPTASEVASGRYALHHDGNGAELANDPSPVYQNSHGTYGTSTNYWFRVSAYTSFEETPMTGAVMPTIPVRGDDLGVENFWTMIPVSYGNVNAATGNMVISYTDESIPGRGSAVSVNRNYNSSSDFIGIFGLGWKSNLEIHLSQEANGNVLFTDEDGTTHDFIKNTDGSFTRPLGLYMDLTKTTNGYTLKDTDQTNYAFDATGKLLSIQDSNNNTVTYSYTGNELTQITDASGRMTSLTYTDDGKVRIITDPVNRTWVYNYDSTNPNLLISVVNPVGGMTQFGYTNNLLSSIKDPNYTAEKPVETLFTYVDGHLTSVKDPRNFTTTFNYDFIAKKVLVVDPKGIINEYYYNVNGNPEKIVVDLSGKNLISTYVYDHNNLVSYSDPKNNATNPGGNPTETNSYDSNGNLVGTTDVNGNAENYQYNTDNNVTGYTDGNNQTYQYNYNGANQITSISPVKTSSANVYDSYGNIVQSTKEMGVGNNLIANSGLERVNGTIPEGWLSLNIYDNGSVSTESLVTKGSKSSVKITSNSTNSALGYIAETQEIPVIANSTYNLSSWIKTQNLTNAHAFLNVVQFDSNGNILSWKDSRFSGLTGTQNWTLRQVTFTTVENAAKVRIYLEVDHTNSSTSGTAWFDNVQLEQGEVSCDFNPIENSSFEQGFNYWTNSSGTGTIETDVTNGKVFEGSKSLKMSRTSTSNTAIQYYQRYYLKPQTPQTPITISGMSKADNVSNGNQGTNGDYAILVKAYRNDGSSTDYAAKFTIGTHDWERSIVTIPQNEIDNIIYVDVYVVFQGNNIGNVWYDNIRIMEGNVTITNKYDAQGNYIEKTTDPLGYSIQYTYDQVGNIQTETDALGIIKSFVYDNLNLLLSVVFPGYDVKLINDYDGNGNITKKSLKSKDESTTYNSTQYSYNENNQLTSVTDPLGKVISNYYDENENLVKQEMPNGDVKEFTYNDGRIKEVKFNGLLRYQYNCDENGNITRIDDISLNQFKENLYDLTNKITKMTTNGGTIEWGYDNNNNVSSEIVTNNGFSYNTAFRYNNINQNTEVIDPDHKSYRFDYDETGKVRTYVAGNASASSFVYDDNDRISQLSIGNKDGSTIASYVYTYDANGNRTSISDQNGKLITYDYDELNQLKNEIDQSTGMMITNQYDPVGNRTSKITKDGNGNTTTVNYSYNAANELTNVDGVIYTYDDNGNLIDDG